MNKKILITGGCRSGKSRHALALARNISGEKLYVATAEALDSEMEERIAKHQQERGEGWETYEEPTDLVKVLKQLENRSGVLVLDCLTLWLSNLLIKDYSQEYILKEAVALMDQSEQMQCQLIFVTNEVGAGIVPENKLARDFRDIVGAVNQLAAQRCGEVVHMVSGIPVTIKPRSANQ
jgi:adenosyl cobinamide kinase/adenosyl cobinamide phosphate guanylyltransferase